MGIIVPLMSFMLTQVAVAPAKPPVITNYWKYLVEVLEKEEARIKDGSNSAAGRRYPTPRDFPFDALRNLVPADLLRAAREGIQEARRKGAGQPPEVLARMAEVNIETALMYYPILADKEEHLNPLIYSLANEKEDAFLRAYLLDRLAPGKLPPSPFSMYFQDALGHEVAKAEDLLKPIIERASEKAQARVTALTALYNYLCIGYRDILERDGAISAFAAERKLPVTAALLNVPEAPRPAGEILIQLGVCNDRAKRFVELCGRLLEKGGETAPELRQCARTLLERFCAEMPAQNLEPAKAVLEQYPADAAAAG